ncbi:MAG: MBL fold metallo-hydrolase, partial [Acidimicrobiia bacterium]|nr:MBL fold metallo-hydrolase [Acidimicrobiia bacterium]
MSASLDPVTLSNQIIDTGEVTGNFNRLTQELTEVAPGLAVIESFSHVWLVETGEGLVGFDTSGVITGAAVVEAMRGWRTDPVHSLVYTHGHVDHVGGSGAFIADADARGHRRPTVFGHQAVLDRLDRYDRTNGWNLAINARQFGATEWSQSGMGVGGRAELGERFLPADAARPDRTYDDQLDLEIGGVTMQLHHARGETDDHTWTWLPDQKAIFCGDLLIWVFPNAGNPQKVQRYPSEWAAALRAMVALDPDMILPAHGLPVMGPERIATVLGDTASAL